MAHMKGLSPSIVYRYENIELSPMIGVKFILHTVESNDMTEIRKIVIEWVDNRTITIYKYIEKVLLRANLHDYTYTSHVSRNKAVFLDMDIKFIDTILKQFFKNTYLTIRYKNSELRIFYKLINDGDKVIIDISRKKVYFKQRYVKGMEKTVRANYSKYKEVANSVTDNNINLYIHPSNRKINKCAVTISYTTNKRINNYSFKKTVNTLEHRIKELTYKLSNV